MDSARLDPASARSSANGHETTSVDFAPKAGPAPERARGPRKLVLCFDGTGNKFHGDDSDSNILKIFRMLDREAEDQYHYYQPGIGTYVASSSLSHTGLKSRFSSWYQKAKDSAIGSSFDQHVVGGYRFLMRFYNPGDEIYMFGFSRGAYIARFLAEMLDYIGLLSHGNEEMVKFAWKAFSQWQCRQGNVDHSDGVMTKTEEKTREMYRFMKGFRETFSRPVGRIKFLGLFDTVNSVPRFETAWMQRSKFPYTARSSARYIRHAVSIDERRAKFRQDLMYQANPKQRHPHLHRLGDLLDWHEDTHYRPRAENTRVSESRGRRPSRLDVPDRQSGDPKAQRGSEYQPYRSRSRSRQSQHPSVQNETDACSVSASVPSQRWEDDGAQDIDEVWFSGGHGDVGGGWESLDGRKPASHVPLAWIVREAMRAGLNFDEDKIAEMGCVDCEERISHTSNQPTNPIDVPRIRVGNGTETPKSPLASPGFEEEKPCSHEGSPSAFHELMHKAHTSLIHDSLAYSSGLGFTAVTAWKLMEWMPFRRMDLKSDGTWEPIRWPLPRGEVRDIPDNVRVHGSVIRRLQNDETYRPGNLIIGGGGRGVRKAGAEHGIGEWECVAEPGDPIGEIWVRKKK
ncbi:hypothetical protein B0I35DRAFT_348836 [Stachybotrys elegans]|uniref:T6SS Phospholipase effector Tle1-like catalytic domain-containing protein n=1 Tax=Stachybotrys elegans TaxID=80388 RepID=A0A8K0STX5_9HYPO|nr:hypothetical protein B0I35DRAFT_348836 [Stachybotrys elegans]